MQRSYELEICQREQEHSLRQQPFCLLPVVHAVVPIKQLARAKSRLAGELSPTERQDLALEMLGQVLQTLLDCKEHHLALAEVWVVSADPAALLLADALGARTIVDRAASLNGALAQARTVARAAGAGGLLVVHGDLPLITRADVAALAQALADGADLVLAPDGAEEGTNALGMAIDAPLSFQFEGRSFARHLAAAAWQELLVEVVRSPTLALDIDTGEALRRYRQEQVTFLTQPK
jgi:2-phospho-L-lactate/phosphoenolpyruvate guanylyltransferase